MHNKYYQYTVLILDPTDTLGCRSNRPFSVTDSSQSSQGQWPWQANIVINNGNQKCSGVIISDRYILSAAHCFGTGGSRYYKLVIFLLVKVIIMLFTVIIYCINIIVLSILYCIMFVAVSILQ